MCLVFKKIWEEFCHRLWAKTLRNSCKRSLKTYCQRIENGCDSGFDAFFEQYLKEETVDLVVVGFQNSSTTNPQAMSYIEPYVRKFKKKYPEIPLVYSDERFTSVLAHKAMLEGGLKKKDRRNKALADEVSATILLQDYMEF